VFSSGDWLSVPSFRNEILQGGFVNAGSLRAPSDHNGIDSGGETSMIAAPVASESASILHRQATNAEVTTTHGSMPRWLIFLAIVYVCGFVASVLAVARQVARIRQVVRRACFADLGTQERASILCKQLKIKLPRVLISDDTNSPFATGVLRPVVVLPSAMMDDLEPDQLDIVLAHELVHIRRRDLLTGWLEVLLTAVWWFHPVIWWLRSRLRTSREECCDDALVASSLARPVRYCETLIRVARYQVLSIAEPVALGFASSEHPAANRIRRLMDGKLLRRDRLRVSAIAVTLLLGLVLLPGMAPDERPVSRTNLEGWFGWRNQQLKISAEEQRRVTELREIAESYFQTRNSVRKFDEPETRDRLKVILKEQPGFFYAQHLLGTWHLRNDDQEEGQRLIDEALDKAPVVLKQRFRFVNGKPLSNTEIPLTTIECNCEHDDSLNSNSRLTYPALVTDDDGQIRVPVYKTVCRINGYSWPDGYHLEETETLGWFESKARTGVLPDMFVWVPLSRPRDFTRTAAETMLLKDASGTRTQEINSGGNTYVLESVSRASRDGKLVAENGRGAAVAGTLLKLPDVKNAAWMDHAVIDLKVPEADQFDVQRAMILDSRTKIPLQQFQSGAGVRVFDNQRFHVYSLWNTLPESIDLVLQVYNYDDGFRLIVPACEGAAVQHNGTTLKIPHLIAGQHDGWSTISGYLGEPRDTNTTCEVELKFTGNTDQKFSVWVALKNGDRCNMKSGGWFSSNVTGGSERLNIPLGEIDHFELRPYVEPTTIFFEDIRLPVRHGELDENVPVVEFPVNQLEQDFTSKVFSPLNIHFRSRRGNVYSGIRGGEFGISLQEREVKQQEPETNCTIVWSTDGSLVCNSLTELVFRLDAKIDPKKIGGDTSFWSNSDRNSVTVQSKNVSLDAVQAVRLHLSSK
jgi:beta-lactamase regulating signal transducer with metallopeptidase domain